MPFAPWGFTTGPTGERIYASQMPATDVVVPGTGGKTVAEMGLTVEEVTGPYTGIGVGAGAGVVGAVPTAQAQPSANLAGIGSLPAILGAAGITVPGWLTAALGVAGAAYGAYQLLGGGEGGGLFGNNLLGGDTAWLNGIELGGPGLPEPSAQYVLKEWHADTANGHMQYYRVQMPGWKKPKTIGYNTRTKRWTVYKPPHLAVIGKNMPRHQMLTRLRHNLSRQSADARTILRITSPKSLRQTRRGRR
jgi:hypothetical protein